jgi:hypothetical protein
VESVRCTAGAHLPGNFPVQVFRSFAASRQLTNKQPFWVSVPMYSIALFLTKVSILLLYLRLFPHERFVKSCWITIAVMGAFLFWTIFGFMFMCTPVNYFWNRSIEGHCFNPKWVYFTNAPFNIVTDFVLFGLPLPILKELQLPRRQKTGLIILFGIGLVYVSASATCLFPSI